MLLIIKVCSSQIYAPLARVDDSLIGSPYILFVIIPYHQFTCPEFFFFSSVSLILFIFFSFKFNTSIFHRLELWKKKKKSSRVLRIGFGSFTQTAHTYRYSIKSFAFGDLSKSVSPLAFALHSPWVHTPKNIVDAIISFVEENQCVFLSESWLRQRQQQQQLNWMGVFNYLMKF